MSDEHKQQSEEAKVIELAEEIVILEELIDLEQWAKAGKTPQRAKRYRIRIDKVYKVVDVHSMTGRADTRPGRQDPGEILALPEVSWRSG